MAGSARLIRGDDVWELRVFVGRDSRGRVRHLHRTFRGSRRAAEHELARLIAAQDAVPAPVPEEPIRWGPTTTLNDAIKAWTENGWEDLSPKTRRDYESTWERHIKSSIGVTCKVVVKAEGELPCSQGNAVRVIDRRNRAN